MRISTDIEKNSMVLFINIGGIMQIGDLLELDDYGVGTVVKIWSDAFGRKHASIWIVAEQRYIFINDWEGFNEGR